MACVSQGIQLLELGAGRGTARRRRARGVDLHRRCRRAPASPWATDQCSDVITLEATAL